MKILTNEEIDRLVAETIATDGVTSLDIVDRMAEAAASEITSTWRPSKPVVVFAGPSKNGAVALSLAGLLAMEGFQVEAYLFNSAGNLSDECIACYQRLEGVVKVTEVVRQLVMPKLTRNMLIIDGLFGAEHRGPMLRGYAFVIQEINESHATVVSIDVPSGLSGDWNPSLVSRDVIHATLTLGMQYPHLAYFISDNAELIGRWKVLDVGLSEKAAAAIMPKYYLVEETDVYRYLRPRNPFSSKADYGHVCLYAGRYGMMGAAVCCARGALRAGAGKVTVESPACAYPVLQSAVPEAMFQANVGQQYIERIEPLLQFDAIAIGPGIGTHEHTVRALEEFLASRKTPIVIDADALNCIAMRPTMLNAIPLVSVITPHEGEFDRLFGKQATAEARIHKAVEVARRYNILIVLKGRHTAIVRPDGKIYFNSSGTPAMATPGSGDVLTGMIAAFMAQKYKPEIASMLAVYLHGLAGEIAAETNGEYGVIASDIAAAVGPAIKAIMGK